MMEVQDKAHAACTLRAWSHSRPQETAFNLNRHHALLCPLRTNTRTRHDSDRVVVFGIPLLRRYALAASHLVERARVTQRGWSEEELLSSSGVPYMTEWLLQGST